ncbi:MAG: flagellar hook-length control protein FliK [Planctomycetota bacterium]
MRASAPERTPDRETRDVRGTDGPDREVSPVSVAEPKDVAEAPEDGAPLPPGMRELERMAEEAGVDMATLLQALRLAGVDRGISLEQLLAMDPESFRNILAQGLTKLGETEAAEQVLRMPAERVASMKKVLTDLIPEKSDGNPPAPETVEESRPEQPGPVVSKSGNSKAPADATAKEPVPVEAGASGKGADASTMLDDLDAPDRRMVVTEAVRTDTAPGAATRTEGAGGSESSALRWNASAPVAERVEVVPAGRLDRMAGPSPAERVEMMERVVRTMRMTLEEGAGRVQIRLNPPQLGYLRMELAMRDGVLSANFQTETPAARHILQNHLPELKESLAQSGIQLGGFSVSVDRGTQGSMSEYEGARRRAGDEEDGGLAEVTAVGAATGAATPAGDPRLLDVVG